jgi:catalase
VTSSGLNSYQFDEAMRNAFNPGQPVYFPNSVNGPEVKADPFAGAGWEADGEFVRS